jgi:hypothetical protein
MQVVDTVYSLQKQVERLERLNVLLNLRQERQEREEHRLKQLLIKELGEETMQRILSDAGFPRVGREEEQLSSSSSTKTMGENNIRNEFTSDTSSVKRQNATVFIGIMSAFNNQIARDAVRNSWLLNLRGEDPFLSLFLTSSLPYFLLASLDGVRARFLMADPEYWYQKQSNHTEPEVQLLENLRYESEIHGDMLFLAGVPEGYQRLADRILALVEWIGEGGKGRKGGGFSSKTTATKKEVRLVENREEVSLRRLRESRRIESEVILEDFVMKTDDDSYIVIDRLYELIQGLPRRRVYWGKFLKNSRVVEDPTQGFSAWYNPEFLSEIGNQYPSYAQGGGYMFSTDILRALGRLHRIAKEEDETEGEEGEGTGKRKGVESWTGLLLKNWALGPEDSMIGAWVTGFEVDRQNDVFGLWDSHCMTLVDCFCAENRTIVLHGVDPAGLLSCWNVERVDRNDICRCGVVANKIEGLEGEDERTKERQFRRRSRVSGFLFAVVSIIGFVLFFLFIACSIAVIQFCREE